MKKAAKINCWEFMRCGREPGGKRTGELGVCPAADSSAFDGLYAGKNAGRACWLVAGTFCNNRSQGSFAKKRSSCKGCRFYQQVHGEEGTTGLDLGFAEIAAHTHAGPAKEANEDRYLVKPLPDDAILMVLADGLGGDVFGDYAAEIACGKFAGFDHAPQGQEAFLLAELIRTIDITVHELTEKDPELTGMGSTLVCVLLRKGRAYWAHVGDSRLYLQSEGELKRVTRDQMLSRFLLEEGEITPEQARTHYSRNVLDQYLGCGSVEPESGYLDYNPEDILLLSTDGLHRQISKKGIQNLLNASKNLEEKARSLVRAAIDAGGKDNITVVLAAGKQKVPTATEQETVVP